MIIAEKPSVAKNIASVLGATNREEGFLSGHNYLVSWCFGHLAELTDAGVLFPSGRPVVSKCPRCGRDVMESKKINLTKKMASALLQDGKSLVSSIYSERIGKPYEVFVVKEDDGKRTHYKLEFTLQQIRHTSQEKWPQP